ncbi:MAG: protein kinase, partial [Candidatus Obscuribacterales bacterium]|nr:protein kinase [Candidatus Obscuribacterales bacterium]
LTALGASGRQGMKRKIKKAGLIPLIRGLERLNDTVEIDLFSTEPPEPRRNVVRVERLSETLQREVCIDWRRVCTLAIDLCGQLAVLHRMRDVHGCLDPDRVVAEHDGLSSANAKIVGPSMVDLASSFEPSDWTDSSGSLFPLELFLSPEQRAGKKASPASDVYALGAIMYAAITGSAPCGQKRAGLSQFGQTEDEGFSLEGYGVPSALEGIIQRCLKANPKDRYKDADAMRAAIIWWDPWVETSSRLGKNRKRRTINIAAGVIAAIAFVAVGLVLSNKLAPDSLALAKPKPQSSGFKFAVTCTPTEFSVRTVPVENNDPVIASDD